MNLHVNKIASTNGGVAVDPAFRHPVAILANVLAKVGLLLAFAIREPAQS